MKEKEGKRGKKEGQKEKKAREIYVEREEEKKAKNTGKQGLS